MVPLATFFFLFGPLLIKRKWHRLTFPSHSLEGMRDFFARFFEGKPLDLTVFPMYKPRRPVFSWLLPRKHHARKFQQPPHSQKSRNAANRASFSNRLQELGEDRQHTWGKSYAVPEPIKILWVALAKRAEELMLWLSWPAKLLQPISEERWPCGLNGQSCLSHTLLWVVGHGFLFFVLFLCPPSHLWTFKGMLSLWLHGAGELLCKARGMEPSFPNSRWWCWVTQRAPETAYRCPFVVE